MNLSHNKLTELASKLKGDLYTDYPTRLLYATDASVYREVPIAVARPKNKEDLRSLIHFAQRFQTSLIPRTAGTSLAGQVVGGGIVVDTSKYMTRVLEINQQEKWVRVEPGVILDELNMMLEPMGLFFGPETSTSNRCMIGGMVGNNSCGAHSLVYGSTRDHTLAVKALLYDGSEVEFGNLNHSSFVEKCNGSNLENKLYKHIHDILSDRENQHFIRQEFPDPIVKRRNTGYAIDLLLDCVPFTSTGPNFNFSRLLAGSEGTLCFFTEIKLNLVPLPPSERALLCVHFRTLEETFRANLVTLQYQPNAVELIDHMIIKQTANNIQQRKNRFFIKGEPAAILIIEYAFHSQAELIDRLHATEQAMRKNGYGYYFPVIRGSDMGKVWALRKSGLGLLSNIRGDARPVSVVEDTAINPAFLPDYMADFQQLLNRLGLKCVYHAHIGSGELHLRPVLNLKDPAHTKLFQIVAYETALLVKKYRGSLSGEHGDGRLRSEFIPLMIGEHNFNLLRSVKQSWDPYNLFNPGKIVDTPPMNTSLRYVPGAEVREPDTTFDFSDTQGILRAAEQCNGSGDCRKTEIIGGTMCPSYMATRDENASTRARANILREYLTNSTRSNPFNHSEIYDIMDFCLSCKGCKAECPSNIDMAKYKAEFLQHYFDANGIPLQTMAIAYFASIQKVWMCAPGLYNALIRNKFTSNVLKSILGIAKERSLPLIGRSSLKHWAKTYKQQTDGLKGKVYLFADEFTNYNDVETGKAAIRLLNFLGYQVIIPEHQESGRTFLSKGLLRRARKKAVANVTILKDMITEATPLVGIEPSAILTFRDEYPDLLSGELKLVTKSLAKNTLMFDEFIMREVENGKIDSGIFTTDHKLIKLHGHCHQKSLASTGPTKQMLSLPKNFHVEEIKSGCCGMAGSFGFEKKHYDLSLKIGELVLLPEIRKSSAEVIIAAPGTSCRQQIKDGTGRVAFHPIEVLYQAVARGIEL
ncbi:MAG: FAD-linked oxidase C-terminal domain-containing protein [Bacteroidales bacterium]|nr:FAD-linked oxidase C-terminal domain-containing protein [Bacteroidales bacterium]